jgi:tRNA threonylcarbamoyladenosine biosynthesis protein TsaE
MSPQARAGREWIWDSPSPGATQRAGEALGRLLRAGDCVALSGELGSGKTQFVRGLAAGFGCDPEAVHSPSFTLVNEYVGGPEPGRCLAHIDLYRIRSESELPGIGWDEYAGRRYAMAVEWADRARASLPADHLWIEMAVAGPSARRVSVWADGERPRRLLRAWMERVDPEAAAGADGQG